MRKFYFSSKATLHINETEIFTSNISYYVDRV